MDNKEILDNFNKAFGELSNEITTNINKLKSIAVSDVNLPQETKDSLIALTHNMEKAIIEQDPTKIFEAIKNYSK